MVLIPFPGVKDRFCVDSSFVYGPRNSHIDQLTAWSQKKNQYKQKQLQTLMGTDFLEG